MPNYFAMTFYPIICIFLTIFLFVITMGKGISCINKCDQKNWTYPSPNTTFVVSPCSGTSIQTQRNSISDYSVGANDVASSVLDQITKHHGNTDFKYNDDS